MYAPDGDFPLSSPVISPYQVSEDQLSGASGCKWGTASARGSRFLSFREGKWRCSPKWLR